MAQFLAGAFWRRSTVWVLLVAVLGGAAGGAVAARVAPSEFHATSRVFVSSTDAVSLAGSQEAQSFETQVAASFARVIEPARASAATAGSDALAFIGVGAAAGLVVALLLLLLRSGRPKPPRGSWRLVWTPRPPGAAA